MLEECGLPYDIKLVNLGENEQFTDSFLKISPNGRMPAIVDPDGPGREPISIFESGAIVEYILAKHGNGRMRPGEDSPEFPTYLQWLHYAEGMLMPHVNILVVETILLPEDRRNPVNIDRSKKQLTRMLGAVDQALEGREFLAGEFSGADIMSGHAATVSARLGGDISDKPNVAAYIKRLNERPGLIKAFAT